MKISFYYEGKQPFSNKEKLREFFASTRMAKGNFYKDIEDKRSHETPEGKREQ